MPDQFKLEVDGDGIALVTWDVPGKSMNLIDVATIKELAGIVEKVAADAAIKGAVITSAKETFSGGADLTLLEGLGAPSPISPRPKARRRRSPSCSRRAASFRSFTGAWRPAASRGSPRSTAPRSAAASNCASPAIIASPPTTTRLASVCPR